MPEASPKSSLDLRRYWSVLWRWKWIFLLVVIALPAGAYFLSRSNTKQYQSSVLMQVQAQSVDLSLFAVGSSAPVAPQQTVDAAARLVTTTGVAQQANRSLRPPVRDPRALLGKIVVTPDTNAGFITITATDPSPNRAAAIANAFGAAVVSSRAHQAIQLLNGAIGQLQNQLGSQPRSNVNARTQLSDQLQRFRALRAAQGNNAQVIEPAVPSRNPVSPRPIRAAVLALVIAIIIGLLLVLAAENMDRRLRDPSELEPISGLPLLGTIPQRAFKEIGHHREEEAFHTLRASITYFNIDHKMTSIVVTSAIQGDGKTTVASNLALAFARAGADVILMDADLRRSGIVDRLGIPRTRTGVARLLVEDATLDEVLVPYEMDEPSAGRLRVMPAGPAPPNPSELIASQRMERLLKLMQTSCDLVIVDTGPILVLSDAIPLLSQASGVVLVSRIGGTSREAVKRATQVARAAGATLLGTVATGYSALAAGPYGSYGGYGGYGHDGHPGRRRLWRRVRRGRSLQPAAVILDDFSHINGAQHDQDGGLSDMNSSPVGSPTPKRS